MIQASNRGFGIPKPSRDNERSDIILDRGRRRLLRVQVKGTGCDHQNGFFSVRTCLEDSGKRIPYTAGHIDFLAAIYSGKRTRSANLAHNSGARPWWAAGYHALSISAREKIVIRSSKDIARPGNCSAK